MAITGLRYVQRAEWSNGPTMIEGAPFLQMQMDGGAWWPVQTVYMNSAGQIRGFGSDEESPVSPSEGA